MDEDQPKRVYVRKSRESYSGMVLESVFRFLVRAIGVIVVLSLALLFPPFFQG